MEKKDIEVKSNTKADLSQNSKGIYVNPEKAGLREGLSNAITAVLKAIDEDHIEREEGVVEVEVNEEEEYLTITDNGIGMTEETIETVLSRLSESDTSQEEGMTGKFGIGFFATFNLAGHNGLVQLHTKSRRNGDEGEYLCQLDTFYQLEKDESILEISDGKRGYGTCIKIDIPGIGNENNYISNVSDWVKELAKYARVPVIYKQIDVKGNEKFNEEYYTPTLKDQAELGKRVHIDEEYFEVLVADTSGEKTFIVLDHPVEEDLDESLVNINYSWKRKNITELIRLKSEQKKVIKGPNKGKTVVSMMDYTSMSEEQQDNCVIESDLEDEDIVLPEPVGTRDKVSKEEDFLEYVRDRIDEKLTRDFKNIKNLIYDDAIDIIGYLINSATKEEYFRFVKRFDTSKYTSSNVVIRKRRNYNIGDNDIVSDLKDMSDDEIKVHTEGAEEKIREHLPENYKSDNLTIFEILWALKRGNLDDIIYIGKTINNKKQAYAEAVEDAIVLEVDTDYYDLLTGNNCKLLKKISIDEDNLENKKEYKKRVNKNKKVNIHGRAAPRYPNKVSYNELEDHIKENEDKRFMFVIDENMSHHYSKAGRSVKLISFDDRDVAEDIVEEADNAHILSDYQPEVIAKNINREEKRLDEFNEINTIAVTERAIGDIEIFYQYPEKTLDKVNDKANRSYGNMVLVDSDDIGAISKYYNFDYCNRSIDMKKILVNELSETEEAYEIGMTARNLLRANSASRSIDDGSKIEFLRDLIQAKNEE